MTVPRLITARRLFAVSCCLLMVIGCGRPKDNLGPTGTVHGRVTFDGRPLDAGSRVTFMQPREGYLAFGVADEQGNYRVSSWNNGALPIGVYQVSVLPGPVDLAPDTRETIDDLPPERKLPPGFPKRYTDFQTSKLTFEVTPGDHKFDVELTK